MYANHKLIACIPTGRKIYLKILIPYLKRALEEDNLDEVRFWMNTSNEDDINYVKKVCAADSRFIMVHDESTNAHSDKGRATCVSFFYQYCLDDKTIYFKIDDDVCYIEKNTFTELAKIRLNQPQFFVIFPMMINTVCTSYLLQQHGRIQVDPPIGGWSEDMGYKECFRAGFHSLDKQAWGNPGFAAQLHQNFTNNHTHSHWKIPNEILHDYGYISINFFCWLGSDFAEFKGIVTPGQDENEINYIIPKSRNQVNLIMGNKVISHYAFYSQRQFLDQIKVNEWYEKLLEKEGLKPCE